MEEFYIGEINGGERSYFVRGSGLGTSRLWYAAVVPMLGVYIELYANSLPLGLLVWVLAVVMGPLACLLDLRYIRSRGADTSQLPPFFVLCPPLYIFRRTKLTRDSSVCGAVWCIMLIYALLFNGFTAAATLEKGDMTSYIKESKWSSIEGMKSVTAYKTIDETLREIGGELEWDAEKKTKDGYIRVTCKSTNNAAEGTTPLSGEFRLDYDGYYIGDYRFEALTIGGKSYTVEEAAEFLNERFGVKDDSSDESEEDSGGEDEAA